MNQQRSRRFRASKETAKKASIRERIQSQGAYVPPEKNQEHFDINCITPVILYRI